MDYEKAIKEICVDALKDLKGKKIVGVRYLTKKEVKDAYWYKRAPVLILDDGTQIVPLADDEGNESGVLEIHHPKEQEVSILCSF